ncbi:MAG: hypothetical protein ACXWUI_04750 [Burkholderiales bacterium]
MRQVQRLNVRAPDEALAKRAVRLLEDALRIASLPDTRSRLLVVRPLNLARFRADASSQAVALALERRILALSRSAVHASAATAGSAAAVWFRDALEAHTLLALRIAEETPADEWFWPLAVPALNSAYGKQAWLRAVTFSVARLDEAAVALPRFMHALVMHGHARAWIDCIGESDVQQRPLHTHRRTAQGYEDRRAVARTIAALEHETGLAAEDARLRWVAEMACEARAGPAFDRDAHDDAIVLRMERARSASDARHDAALAGDRNLQHPRSRSSRSHRVAQGANIDARHVVPASVERAAGTAQAKFAESQDPTRGHPLDAAPRPGAAPSSEAVPTAAAGLLFLLPVLARIGYVEWIRDAPEWSAFAIGHRVLALACTRLGLPIGDPAWALGAASASAAQTPDRYSAPPIWTHGIADSRKAWLCARERSGSGTRLWDASGRLLLAAWPRTERPVDLAQLLGGRHMRRKRCDARASNDLLEDVTNGWLTACRRWLRRYAGIGIASLVLRQGRLTLTPTHADVEFALSAASLAVRRTGLDIDPGWMPWFGRVVAFHYTMHG